jgi:hypothetical protein
MENIEKQLKSKPIVLKYLKNRYETDEEYKKAQIEKGKLRYQLHKEEILERNKNDEEYKKKRVEICKKYYLKKQEKEKKEKENKPKRPRGRPRKIKEEEGKEEEVHIIANS